MMMEDSKSSSYILDHGWGLDFVVTITIALEPLISKRWYFNDALSPHRLTAWEVILNGQYVGMV